MESPGTTARIRLDHKAEKTPITVDGKVCSLLHFRGGENAITFTCRGPDRLVDVASISRHFRYSAPAGHPTMNPPSSRDISQQGR